VNKRIPKQLFLSDGESEKDRVGIIAWSDTNKLEFTGRATLNGEYLGIGVEGSSPMNLTYSVEVVVKPVLDIIS